MALGFRALAAAALAAASGIHFENVQVPAGIHFVLHTGSTPDKPLIDTMSGGVALLDFDGDGYLDIYFVNGARIPSLRKEDPSFYNRLYRNNHNGTFTDVTDRAGVRAEGYSMGAAAADYDNDGLVDLYVTGFNRNILFHNKGDGTFTDVTDRAGVSVAGADGKKPWSVSAAWLDYDNDGRLDLFVTNYVNWTLGAVPPCGPPEKRLSCPPTLFKGLPNTLFHNNGDGTFTDVSVQTGIAAHVGKGMGLALADYDGDGWIDILVANDNERNFLFRNLQGKRFVETGVEAGVAFNEDGVPVSSMGADFRDWNNDGFPDVAITALSGETFPMHRNEGNGLFSADAYRAGLGLPSFRLSGWGIGIYDFDNDGRKDLFSANSHVSENADESRQQHYKQPNALFQNAGRAFQDVTRVSGLAGLPGAAHRGAAFGDLNNDGKVDVVTSVLNGPPEILMNRSVAGNHWLLIRAIGKRSNRDAIGLRIKVTDDSGTERYNHVTQAGSYASSNDLRAHFGLGSSSRAREIELRWPSGTVQKLRDVRSDQLLTIKEE